MQWRWFEQIAPNSDNLPSMHDHKDCRHDHANRDSILLLNALILPDGERVCASVRGWVVGAFVGSAKVANVIDTDSLCPCWFWVTTATIYLVLGKRRSAVKVTVLLSKVEIVRSSSGVPTWPKLTAMLSMSLADVVSGSVHVTVAVVSVGVNCKFWTGGGGNFSRE